MRFIIKKYDKTYNNFVSFIIFLAGSYLDKFAFIQITTSKQLCHWASLYFCFRSCFLIEEHYRSINSIQAIYKSKGYFKYLHPGIILLCLNSPFN